jgi:hypothetical protein
LGFGLVRVPIYGLVYLRMPYTFSIKFFITYKKEKKKKKRKKKRPWVRETIVQASNFF